MILDSSAVTAIFLKEPEAEALLKAIADAPIVGISAATFVEVGIVLSHRLNRPMQDDLDYFFSKMDVQIIAFDNEHRMLALNAWWQFGRTRSKANLNFGDCIAYATAKLSGQPLLYKGDDFPLTDVRSALDA